MSIEYYRNDLGMYVVKKTIPYIGLWPWSPDSKSYFLTISDEWSGPAITNINSPWVKKFLSLEGAKEYVSNLEKGVTWEKIKLEHE